MRRSRKSSANQFSGINSRLSTKEWLTENPCFLKIQPHYQRNHQYFYGATGTFLLLTSTASSHELHFGSKSHKLDAPHPLNASKTAVLEMNSGRFFVRATVSTCILFQQQSTELVNVARQHRKGDITFESLDAIIWTYI